MPRVPLIHGRRRGFHDSANLNLAKRRLCAALGISLGRSEHCCAISVARVRAALTASIPRSNRPLAQRTNFGAAKSCPLVIIFMIRQSGESNYAHRSRPYHGSRNSGDSERPTGMQSGGFETAGRWVGRQWAYVMKSLGQNRKSFGYGRPAKTRLICRRCGARMQLARQLPWLDHRLPAVLLFQCTDCGHVDMVEWPASEGEEAP